MVEASLVKLPWHECHLDFTDDQSTLVQVMAWCRQATSHYLSQCWPWSLSSYGVTRPQWVNMVFPVLVRQHLYIETVRVSTESRYNWQVYIMEPSCRHLNHIFIYCVARCALWNLKIDSSVPGRCGRNFRSIIFKLIIENSSLHAWCEITVRRI